MRLSSAGRPHSSRDSLGHWVGFQKCQSHVSLVSSLSSFLSTTQLFISSENTS